MQHITALFSNILFVAGVLVGTRHLPRNFQIGVAAVLVILALLTM